MPEDERFYKNRRNGEEKEQLMRLSESQCEEEARTSSLPHNWPVFVLHLPLYVRPEQPRRLGPAFRFPPSCIDDNIRI